MITLDDLKAAYPQVYEMDADEVQKWVDVANATITPARLVEPRLLDQAQMWFVMHQLEKPAGVDLTAPHVLARVSVPGRRAAGVKAPSPWAGTVHGESLIRATRP